MEFVDHASLRFAQEGRTLLTDPWYTGRAFDDGWSLLSGSTRSLEDVRPDAIWYSHEHPDHFSIADLRQIDPADRPAMTITARRGKDRKILNFCEGLGFRTFDLEADRWHDIIPGLRGRSGQVGSDSWLCVDDGAQRYLNTNDCQFRDEAALRLVREALGGPVDVLATQFTYANWAGNPDDDHGPEIAQNMVDAHVRRQIEVFEPRYVVLFASFVWACHEENHWWNDRLPTPGHAAAVVAGAGADPVLLVPGQRWRPGDRHDFAAAVRFWQEARARAAQRPRVRSEPCTLEQLQHALAEMRARLAQDNDMQALARVLDMDPTLIRVEDLNLRIELNICDEPRFLAADGPWDVSLSSAALRSVFRDRWGRGTLTVNGRFRANYRTFERFIRQTQLYYLNNIGRTYPGSVHADELAEANTFALDLTRAVMAETDVDLRGRRRTAPTSAARGTS